VADGVAGLERDERSGLSVECVLVRPVVSATRCAATADDEVAPPGAVPFAVDDPALTVPFELSAATFSELACLFSGPELGVSARTEAAESVPAKRKSQARVREIAETVPGSLRDLNRSVGMTATLPTAFFKRS